MAQGMVFEDIFNVKDIDPNGKQFDRGEFIVINLCYCSFVLLLLRPEVVINTSARILINISWAQLSKKQGAFLFSETYLIWRIKLEIRRIC